MKATWHPLTKAPRLYRERETVTLPANRFMSYSTTVQVRRSKDVLMRSRHGATHHRLGDEGWKDYPDSQAGRYKYFIGCYLLDENGKGGWQNEHGHEVSGHEVSGVEWTPLPRCVDAGYTW